MSRLNFSPSFNFLSAFGGASLGPLHTLVRTTEERLRPSRVAVHRANTGAAQVTLFAAGKIDARGWAQIIREGGTGRMPTIVLGGLVPDSSEQVFLLRRSLLKSGDLYYVNYPRDAFSLDQICAQLTDLVTELAVAGQPPVVFGVSFGAGLILEWLRRRRVSGVEPLLAGTVLVSPVTCVTDLIPPGTTKPTTLIGRALKPFLAVEGEVTAAAIERSRSVFLRMFEAGAQNKRALGSLMSAAEALRLKSAVMAAINGITPEGARQRVGALTQMVPPMDYFSPQFLPLSPAPTLILFAESESAVLDERAPALLAFERAHRAYFSQGTVRRVESRWGAPPVQHASLIFHVFDFLPPVQSFYRELRRRALALAA
jgi:pimeloyl-ACP methyl ester carboxylesterase